MITVDGDIDVQLRGPASEMSAPPRLVQNPELRPVVGPGAIGGGWRRFVDLLYLMAVTDFKKAYFETVLGYAWSLLRPLMLFGVLLVVFTQIFRIGSADVENYEVFLLLNIVLFSLLPGGDDGRDDRRSSPRRESSARPSSRAS